ncbi:N-alpha-acetyltransferase 50, partial [Geodia barretti]
TRTRSGQFVFNYTDDEPAVFVQFYKDVLELGSMAKLAYFNDLVVGAVCCRVETEGDKHRMYIMTLGCLAPYRRLGIGTALLNHVLQKARDHGNIDNIYLHVQINNEDALAFYRKFDFHSVETKEQYYKRIDPPHAHVLQKDMRGCMTAAEPPVPPELSTNVTDTDSMD